MQNFEKKKNKKISNQKVLTFRSCTNFTRKRSFFRGVKLGKNLSFLIFAFLH